MGDVKSKVVIIVGATGSGKSDLAIALARKFRGEIICADSRTVYRGMDAGTAKPVPNGRTKQLSNGSTNGQAHGRLVAQSLSCLVSGVRHHLLDIRNPDEPYSVAEFKEDAERCIRDIAARGRLPIVVGGTMLYIRALVDNLNLAGAQPNPARRMALEQLSLPQLRKMLTAHDPDAGAVVDMGNPRRLIRAIETLEATGMTLASARAKHESPFDMLILGVDVPRDVLHQRIAARTHAMFARGLVAETQRLLAQYGPDIEPLRGVVYREVVAWLAGTDAVAIVEGRINAALRRYARRQLAWFRKDERVRWVQSVEEAIALVASCAGPDNE